ncbi:MAG: hypothetical protein Harvfovirus14_21 [Harvfovirus sp.]|uniref:Uncharacterized protein n=1 Tax=Harvfovirus sp. TaxID=2487768 RepID=A0A3G5A1N8_9VIRU|nr:MAG: hypothetical protein Harvfovirus14_21 [Harvfovirus sp.]
MASACLALVGKLLFNRRNDQFQKSARCILNDHGVYHVLESGSEDLILESTNLSLDKKNFHNFLILLY